MIEPRDRQPARGGYTLRDLRGGESFCVWPDVELVVISDHRGQPVAVGQSPYTRVTASLENADSLLTAWRSLRAAWTRRQQQADGHRDWGRP